MTLSQLQKEARENFAKKWQAKYEIHPQELGEIYDDLITHIYSQAIEDAKGVMPEEASYLESRQDCETDAFNFCRAEAITALDKLKGV